MWITGRNYAQCDGASGRFRTDAGVRYEQPDGATACYARMRLVKKLSHSRCGFVV
ncbi:hypothetical protein BVG79_01927 [Ketogulonicigenium robustum]|uniref:Uncharacterized protein n=1 Tax=Ketogulonicigenium robustum TaxID=92947 RepID=A0A1W6P1F7_9RHOB|nr:hypothetical protein BVG79_01927 [Ketogulonicigenium robustum]